jgi:hypothetical protein
MDRGRVGEERGGKEMDRCPLTLADAGFGACDALLVPYRKVCYHLAEWGRAGVRWASDLQ